MCARGCRGSSELTTVNLHIPEDLEELLHPVGVQLQSDLDVEDYQKQHFHVIPLQRNKDGIGEDNNVKHVREVSVNEKHRITKLPIFLTLRWFVPKPLAIPVTWGATGSLAANC